MLLKKKMMKMKNKAEEKSQKMKNRVDINNIEQYNQTTDKKIHGR